MQPLPSPFQEILDARTAYIKTVSVIASRGDVTVAFDVSSGSLVQDARRTLRWNGTLNLPVETDFLPTLPSDLLTPFGTTVDVFLGVESVAGVSASVPFGSYDLDDSRVVLAADSREVAISLVDLGERLARYRFESPFEIPPSTDLADAVNLVVNDRLNLAANLDPTGVTLDRARIFGLDPGLDPAREVVDLVDDFGYRIWFNRVGTLVLDQPPTPDTSLALALAGELTVTGAWVNRPPNVIVMRGEASDGTTPIQSVAYDSDPNSPTYAGAVPGESNYGRVTSYHASPLITTQVQADVAARNMLAESAAEGATWEVSKAYDPTIDPDDVIAVNLDPDTSLPLVVDSVTVDVSGATSMNCRAISQLD